MEDIVVNSYMNDAVNNYMIVVDNNYLNVFFLLIKKKECVLLVPAIIYFIFQEQAVNNILILALIDLYMILFEIKFKL